MPGGFHRIRHYGLFANGTRADNIAQARKLLNVPASQTQSGDTNAPKADEPPALAQQRIMSQKLNAAIAVAGIDIGKNSFHVPENRPCLPAIMTLVSHPQRG